MFTVSNALIDARIQQLRSATPEEAEFAVQQLEGFLNRYDLTPDQRARITRELPPRDPKSPFQMIGL